MDFLDFKESEVSLPNNKHTRTPNGSGSIRKRPDGRWEGRFSNGFDPITGKQVQHSVYGKTQKEVRQKISKITNEIDEKTYIDPCTMTLNEFCQTRTCFIPLLRLFPPHQEIMYGLCCG